MTSVLSACVAALIIASVDHLIGGSGIFQGGGDFGSMRDRESRREENSLRVGN